MLPEPLKFVKFAVFLILGYLNCFAGTAPDSILAQKLESAAQSLYNQSRFDSSLIAFQEAAGVWENEGRWDDVVRCMIMVAYNQLSQGDFISGYNTLTEAENNIQKHPIRTQELLGKIHILKGHIYSQKGEHAGAQKTIERGLEVYERTIGSDNSTYASALYALASATYFTGQYERTLELVKRAEVLQSKHSGVRSTQRATTLTLKGLVLDAKNEFDPAIDAFLEALNIFEEHGKHISSEAGLCYLNLLSTSFNKGDYRSALEYGKSGIEIYHRLGLTADFNVAGTYSKLGEVYTVLGDIEKAIFHLQHALVLFQEHQVQKQSAIGVLHQLLANAYERAGETGKAFEYSHKGIAILEQAYDTLHPQIGFMYEHAGDMHRSAGRYSEALLYYRKAMAAREHIGTTTSRNDIAFIHSSIGLCYLLQGKRDSARHHLTIAAEMQSKSRQVNIAQKAAVLQRFGDLHRGVKRYDRALRAYHDAMNVLSGSTPNGAAAAVPPYQQSVYKKELLELVTSVATLLEDRYAATRSVEYLEQGLTYYSAALDIIDDLRRRYTADGSKAILSERSAAIYGSASRLALRLYAATKNTGYRDRAFLIADRSKANMLLDKVSDGGAKHFAGIPDSLLEQEKELLNEISFLDIRMQKNGAADGVAGENVLWQKQKFTLRERHGTLIELFEQKYPAYFALKYSRPATTVAEIQSMLDPGTAIVQYLAGERDILLFVLTRDRLTVRTLPDAPRVYRQAGLFVDAITKFDADEYRRQGAALYRSILRPAESDLRSATDIIVIPDGRLHYVPFEALPVGGAATTTDFTSLPYLITRYAVSYAYSAEFLKTMNVHRRPKHGAVTSFAGFAPVFRDSLKNGNFLANRAFVEESGLSDVRSITLDGKKFNELRYSEDEINSISRSFGEQAMPSRTFLHTDATESNFKKYSGTVDIVHIATHGYINEKNPKQTAILFSQPAQPGRDDDGILYVNETFTLSLDADLVVLSSCESGIGAMVKGEGMMTLTRGLFYAGARNIMYSLWKVPDKQTSRLMERFYSEMLAGKPYAAALRDAKLSMIASKESAFPAKWSAFVLMGR
jgi:CHAT domain-containing protein/tetratricopeptide (TPR) repeat protein